MSTIFDIYDKKVAVLTPTLKCDAACRHCILSCSPNRRETMSDPLLEKCTRQFLDGGFDPICLTGGEPFIFSQKIQAVANLCQRGSVSLVVQTNGNWASSPTVARRILREVPGITQLGFSVDYLHMEFIPRRRVCNGIEAAYASGIDNVSLSVTYQTCRERQELEEYFRRRFPRLEITSWPVTPLGRAAKSGGIKCESQTYDWQCLTRHCEAQGTFTPIVMPNGDLHLCYHLIMLLGRRDPFFVGNLNKMSIGDLLRAGDTPLYRFVLAYGGGSLGYLAEELSPGLLERRYQRVCSFCYEVFRQPRLVDKLRQLVATDQFKSRVSEAVSALWAPRRRSVEKRSKTLVLCRGRNCFGKEANVGLRHYLVNQLVDSGRYRDVKVECVECLGHCKEGPNAEVKPSNQCFHRLDTRAIDALIETI